MSKLDTTLPAKPASPAAPVTNNATTNPTVGKKVESQTPSSPPFPIRTVLDIVSQFYCIRCGALQPNENKCEITLGNPMKMSLNRYFPICPACLSQLQEKTKPRPQQT